MKMMDRSRLNFFSGCLSAVLLLSLFHTGGCQKYMLWREAKYQEMKKADQPATKPATFKDPTLSDNSKETPVRPKDPNEPVKRSSLEMTIERPDGAIGPAILVINRDYITADEVIRRAKPQLEATALTYERDVYERRAAEIFAEVIRELISETMLYQEIAFRITDEQEPAVKRAVEKEVNNLATMEAGGSKVLLDKMLTEHGSSMEELEKQLRKQIITQQYLREKMKPKVIVTRDDLWGYYQENIGDFVEPASVHLLLIEVDADKALPDGITWDHANPDDRRKAQAVADEVLKEVQKRLAKGEDFSTVAKALSTAPSRKVGGDMGWISKGSYRMKKLEDAAFALNVGQVSSPIVIEPKTFIIKVKEFNPGRTVSFAEAQEKIKLQMEQAIYRKLVMEYLGKLTDKAQIGSIEEFLDEVMARLPEYETMRKKGKK